MRKEPASATRALSDDRASRVRSAVTNGRRLHVVPVGDTAWSRRFRDVLAEITGDLGGTAELSEAQRQLARRAATIALECEKLEAKAVAGEVIDMDLYGQMTDRLGRAFGRLGLKRVARDVTPTLAEYITRTYGSRNDRDDDNDAEDNEQEDKPSRSSIARYRPPVYDSAAESIDADLPSDLAPAAETALPVLPTPGEVLSSAGGRSS
jgi:hypothetical protein